GREGRFNRQSWSPSLGARRILNWLRHFNVLVDGADSEQTAAITRSLHSQVQALRLRGALAPEPVDRLLAAIALLGMALCGDREAELTPRVGRVQRLLEQQIDGDGLHRSRSARMQVQILVELITVDHAL